MKLVHDRPRRSRGDEAGLRAPHQAGLLASAAAVDVLLRVRGTVQGVGFRPFVHRVASQQHLRGWVQNDSLGVLIRAAGPAPAVAALRRALETGAPSAAQVQEVETQPVRGARPIDSDGFTILASEGPGLEIATATPPDLALCADCQRELLDPRDRRHRYPFINCTQCGPRYSILEILPYDRPRTTMRTFRMCPKCQAEYDDPSDRRFHAQPNACPACGPALSLTDDTGAVRAGDDALRQAVALLQEGGVVAVKGLGGYHLFVDAQNEAAVAKLRRRKQRDEKPLAVMFPDLASLQAHAEVPAEAAALLRSPAAPIVLLQKKPGTKLAPGIAPGNPWIGALLPYTPLHVLLLQSLARPLVATSANLAEEPLCIDAFDAYRRLLGIADAFLEHNRRIAHPADDSVVRLSSVGPICLRRARGYAPTPVRLPRPIDGCLLCVGAQMKNTIAVASQDQVALSPHIGDLERPATRQAFSRAVDILGALGGRPFTGVVHDRHPDYASTAYALSTGLPTTAVQHHLAHVLSCLLEYRHPADGVLGVAWDGTGYGEDGTIWGGEFLLLRKNVAHRFGRLRPFQLPGGEAAIRDGRRSALGLAHAADRADFAAIARQLGCAPLEADTLQTMLTRGLNSPATTSAGRLFDAVGAMLGLGGPNHFEGQTALAVEAAALPGRAGARALPLPLRFLPGGAGAVCELNWEPLFDAVLEARNRGISSSRIAADFHLTLATGIVSVARAAGVGTVALSGGCFQNALLLELTAESLRCAGFEVLTHRALPPNDGGIAAGQALAALLNLTSVQLP